MAYVFDIEADGLLATLTKAHCLVAICEDTEEVLRYRPETFVDGLMFIQDKDLIAHNGINYDLQAIKKLYPWFNHTGKIHDTLVYCKLLWSNIGVSDAGRVIAYQKSNGLRGLPPKLRGSHSLKAWGYRLKCNKDEPPQDWSVFTEEMLEYCEQDVVVNLRLWQAVKRKIAADNTPQVAINMEHDAAKLLSLQERNGFKFNESKAVALYAELAAQRSHMREHLVKEFGSWYVNQGVKTPKRTLNYKDPLKASRVAGAPFTAIKHVEFNPTSRQHIAKVLMERINWCPREFTPSGQPKIDESILKHIKTKETEMLCEYFIAQKCIGMLAEGDNAWLKLVTADGYIHGSINPNGAVTGRATHSKPNIAQVPSGKTELGVMCRQLFTVPDGWHLVGSDASGLELRCLGHFMAKYDGGAYIKVILEGDIHTANQEAAKLGTRDEAKRFIYAFLYGAGDELIGELVGYSHEEYEAWKAAGKHKGVINQLERKGEKWTRKRVCHILKGKEVKKQFLLGLPALKKLIDWCKNEAKENGYITALDGRRIYVRSPHSALNSLLQSAGALICKLWIIEVDKLLQAQGLKHGRNGDYFFSAWVHDEIQVAAKTRDIAEKVGKACQEAMGIVEKTFQFNCPLDAEFDVGNNWSETH